MDKKSIKQAFSVSTWFYRRTAIAIVATAGMALYFLYDGAIGYPKKNQKAEMYQAFMTGVSGADLANPAPKPDVAAAYQSGKSGGTWAGFAASKNLPSKKPKVYSDTQIRNQFIYGAILGLVCLGVVAWLLMWRRRKYLLHESAFTTPQGQYIPFADVQSIDLEKWDRGVAKVAYQTDGKTGQVKVDDYKFAGVGDVLKQLVKEFPEVEIAGNREWLTKMPSGKA